MIELEFKKMLCVLTSYHLLYISWIVDLWQMGRSVSYIIWQPCGGPRGFRVAVQLCPNNNARLFVLIKRMNRIGLSSDGTQRLYTIYHMYIFYFHLLNIQKVLILQLSCSHQQNSSTSKTLRDPIQSGVSSRFSRPLPPLVSQIKLNESMVTYRKTYLRNSWTRFFTCCKVVYTHIWLL